MDFEVDRRDFRRTRTAASHRTGLSPGQIRLEVERFALTTNNVTYAVVGDMFDYWGFFPTEAPWGRLPVMGLGSVIESAHPDIAVGGRYFGFYPMSSEAVITAEPRSGAVGARPDGARSTGEVAFRDVGAHRAQHAATYTDFRDVSGDTTFNPDRVDEYLLLWGMFMTSFLVDDYLGDPDAQGEVFRGACQTLVTSASSKTSICLAACLARRGDHHSIGVTSPRNRAFVEGLGLYDEVIAYGEIDRTDASVASGLVDMAGSGPVRSAIHTHFADNLKFSIAVGATHWEDMDSDGDLPGPPPELFFAPGQSAKRARDWGPDELASRTARAFNDLLDHTERWLTVVHRTGPDGIEATYRELLEGQADPSIGYVCSMNENRLS
ncbi:MAG: DUF2855 family protein [Acidimicrobiaceae bacterium]|nr:DUF2855 family protein [Acidimicrobiaceae bacterium]MXZ65805.1 DUF2855 family protein [Acidimicrobiaceae bacterium]MYF32635.1 DUF2855 family protein [Acidimicrobiaceae bacterium]MYG77548.1 DUF2855 family protein [Acidimicrobiaceae bacterium]MYJ84192.1 DUF2855 family protein [Acidimicrobiaceae bacterium]